MHTSSNALALAFLSLSVGVGLADDAKTEQRVVGRISSVRPDQNLVVIQPRKGPEITLTADDRSHFEIDQKDVTLKAFTQGMRVRAVYTTTGGSNRIVVLSDPLLTANKIGRAIVDAFDAAKNYTFEEKAKYERRLEPVLNDLDDRINELAEQADEATPEVKQEMERSLVELRRQRDVIQEKLKRVEAATPAAWDDVKSGVNAAIDDLRKGIERARSRTK